MTSPSSGQLLSPVCPHILTRIFKLNSCDAWKTCVYCIYREQEPASLVTLQAGALSSSDVEGLILRLHEIEVSRRPGLPFPF